MEVGLGILGITLGYSLGSVPSAYLAARAAGRADIRSVGTGNVGALNTYQEMGLAAGLAVLAADVAKGVVAVLLPDWLGAPDWASYGAAVAVVAGHTWPATLGFRGGKGAATLLGVGLALAPLLALISLIPVIAAVAAVRNIVIGVALALLLFNVLTFATGEPLGLALVCLALTLGVVGNYLSRTIAQTLSAIRRKRWRSMVFPD